MQGKLFVGRQEWGTWRSGPSGPSDLLDSLTVCRRAGPQGLAHCDPA